jgi:hypothetical protein
LLLLIESALNVDTSEVKQGNIPLFVGKTVKHKFQDGSYKGKVICIVPGFPQWYNVKYEDDPSVYAYNLKEDNKKGDLEIIIEKE